MPDIFDEVATAPAADIFDQLDAGPSVTEPQEEPGRITKQPSGPREWGRFMLGGLLHPIRQTETAIEQAAIQLGLADPGSRLMPGLSLSRALERPILGSIPQIPQQKGTAAQIGAGAVNVVSDFLNFFGTPEGIATLGLGSIPATARKIILSGFAGSMATEAPEQLRAGIEAAKEGKYQQASQQLLGGTGGVLLSAAIGNTIAKPAPTHPSVMLPRSMAQLEQAGEGLRTIPFPGEPKQIPYRVPSSLESGVLQPAGAATIAVDPAGRSIVLRELSPLEQTEAMRGPREYVPREEVVRPAQAEPVVIGESRAAELARQTPEIIEPTEIVPATQAATAPGKTEAGGEVSFGAEAKAEAIPSARQAALPPPDPSPQALGIMPPGMRLLGQIVEAIKPKAQGALPRTRSTAGDWLGDLGDRAANKEIAIEPTGIGRIPVLNWLFDPRHRAKTEPEKAILTYFYEQGVGRANVQALSSSFGTRFKRLFPRNEAGEFTNVGRTREGQSLHPSDVFEELQRNPDAYQLTPPQRQAFDELMRYEKRARELEKKYNLSESPDSVEMETGARPEGAYYTRGKVVGEPRRPGGVGGVALGGKQFFQKKRAFESEQQGVSRGFKYPMNVDDRIILRLSRLYKAIGDRRLAEDKGLGGRWGSETGPVTYQESQVFQPSFKRGTEYRIFPVEVAKKVNDSIGAQQTAWLKTMASINDFSKGMTLGFDWGAGQIQGLITAFRDPSAWAKAQATSLKAFGSRDVFAEYVRNNAQEVRELAEFGSGIGTVPEMVAGLSEGGAVSAVPKIIGKSFEQSGLPGVGKAISKTQEVPQAFGRLFQTFLDVAKIEKWKSRRETIPREEWPRAIQEIEHELNLGRMESIGLSPGQALAERLFLLAPSYYRGGLGLIGDMAAKGVTGAQARRAMGSYMAGILATYAAGATAVGMPPEEIVNRLNPSSGNFLMIPIKMGGKSIEVGFGGIMRSFMRLAGSVIKTSIQHPENWGSLTSEKNPFIKWLRGHSAPVPKFAWDQFSGKDYAGEDADMSSLARGSLPLVLQSWLKQEKGQTGEQTAADMIFSFGGLLSWPQNTRNRILVERNRLASEKYGQSYDNLKIRQQAAVTRELERSPEFAAKPPSTPRQIEQAFRHQVERQEAVQAGLDKTILDVLKAKELHVRGFEPTMKIGPTEIYLTRAQMDRYKALIIEENNRVLKGRLKTLSNASPQRAQTLLDEWTQQAKQRARARLQLEFNR